MVHTLIVLKLKLALLCLARQQNKQGYKSDLTVMLRFTTADKGRKGTLTVDGVKIADITVPSEAKDAVNGFYNVEYAIPANLCVDKQGQAKEKFVVRLTASSTTFIPGLYYMRLMCSQTQAASLSAQVAGQPLNTDQAYYTLGGTRVSQPQKGIYVTQGKTVLVR